MADYRLLLCKSVKERTKNKETLSQREIEEKLRKITKEVKRTKLCHTGEAGDTEAGRWRRLRRQMKARWYPSGTSPQHSWESNTADFGETAADGSDMEMNPAFPHCQ